MNSRGMTLIEAVFGIGMIATMTLSMALLFKTTMLSARKTGRQTEILADARRSLHGEGAFSGMLFAGLSASSAAAAGASSLALVAADGNTTTFSLSAAGDLLETKPSGTATRAKGLSNLVFTYYGLDSSGLIVESTSPAQARLVAASFRIQRPEKSIFFHFGASLRNRE